MRLLKNATLVTAAKVGEGAVLIDGDRISAVWWADSEDYNFRLDMFLKKNPEAEISDLTEKHIIAGGIDAHVHFREPGLTHKADMATESRAAAAGGITTVFDMPNTKPATTEAVHLAERCGNCLSCAERRCRDWTETIRHCRSQGVYGFVDRKHARG